MEAPSASAAVAAVAAAVPVSAAPVSSAGVHKAAVPGDVGAGEPFFLGINIPWRSFGMDIGTSEWNKNWWDSKLKKAADSGANSVRMWLHVDGRSSPKFSGRRVTGMGAGRFADDLKALVKLARDRNLVLQICLWSFDMCKNLYKDYGMRGDLITDESLTQSYIDNALVPMLGVLNSVESDHVVIEVINEPEWCMTDGSRLGDCENSRDDADDDDAFDLKECVPAADMQRFVALIAKAVHDHSSLAVTVGAASLKWASTRQNGVAAYWSDSAMRKYGGAAAELDLLNVHLWEWMYPWHEPCKKGHDGDVVEAEQGDRLRRAAGLVEEAHVVAAAAVPARPGVERRPLLGGE